MYEVLLSPGVLSLPDQLCAQNCMKYIIGPCSMFGVAFEEGPLALYLTDQ